MAKTIKYTYWDSCVFLAYFNNEAGRAAVIDQLLEQVRQGEVQKIITSVISITEVAFIAAERTKLSLGIEEEFDKMWQDVNLIEFVDIHQILARKARTLMREAKSLQYTLKAADALHLVSAQLIGAEKFFTYDRPLFRFSASIGMDIVEPYIDQPRLF